MTADEEIVVYLQAARTHTPEQDAELAAKHDKYDPTPEERLLGLTHEPFASAA